MRTRSLDRTRAGHVSFQFQRHWPPASVSSIVRWNATPTQNMDIFLFPDCLHRDSRHSVHLDGRRPTALPACYSVHWLDQRCDADLRSFHCYESKRHLPPVSYPHRNKGERELAGLPCPNTLARFWSIWPIRHPRTAESRVARSCTGRWDAGSHIDYFCRAVDTLGEFQLEGSGLVPRPQFTESWRVCI